MGSGGIDGAVMGSEWWMEPGWGNEWSWNGIGGMDGARIVLGSRAGMGSLIWGLKDVC